MHITKAMLRERIDELGNEAAQYKTQAEANLNVQNGRIAELEHLLSVLEEEYKKGE
jgi:hypothetical protein